MDTVTEVQILHETVCYLHHANYLERGMDSTILPSAMVKQ